MASFQTSKRTACDRCRSQKLRCPTRELGTNSCTRCIRLGAWCVTSYPRPSGRVGKSGSQALRLAHSHTQPELRPKEIESEQLLPGSRTTGLSSITNTTNPNPNPNTSTGPNKNPSNDIKSNSTGTASTALASQQNSKTTTIRTTGSGLIQDSIPENNYDALPWSVGDDNMDGFGGRHMGNLFADASMCLDRPSGGQLHYDLEDLTCVLSPPPSNAPSAAHTVNSSSLEGSIDVPNTKESRGRQQSDTVMNMNEPSTFLHILECDPRLSSLVLDMSRRIQQCTAISGPQDSPILDVSRSGDSSPAPESDMTKLIGDALGDLSEFLVIIQLYDGSQYRQNVNSKNGSGPTNGIRIGIVVILNLLSAYLQIVAIFDRIFQTLCNQLSESSSSSSESMPGLHLNGFSLQAGNLQTKILSHAILHQFEIIVRILGMPPELRVTDKPEHYSGLFEDERARALLAAISSGKGYHMAFDDGCDLRAVESLRDTIKRVQMLL